LLYKELTFAGSSHIIDHKGGVMGNAGFFFIPAVFITLHQKFPACSAGEAKFSVREATNQFNDSTFAVCYHIGYGVPLRAHTQGTGGVI
jgi:hypothetical protein